MEQLTGLAERAVANDDATSPSWTADLLTALHDIGADGQIAALLARNPAAHADLTDQEPPDAILDLITALYQVGADAQVTALAERAVASADPDDLLSTSELLIAMHADGKRTAGA